MTAARRFVVRGTVQGVGFRPFVAGLAAAHELAGWVLNADRGVEIHIEGRSDAIEAFARALRHEAPPAARIDAIDSLPVTPDGCEAFRIRDSERRQPPTVRIPPDLPVCSECLEELSDPAARRFEYPYITCTRCGPRYSIVLALPYDRERTTMAEWPMCAACTAEYADPGDRRFHAQPLACPACGPRYTLLSERSAPVEGGSALSVAGRLLRQGALVAVKGIGGYHLCCDARNAASIDALRIRKFRKSRPFAIMARDLGIARTLVDLDAAAEAFLTSPAHPIVLAPGRVTLPGVAPGHRELGVMLPYAPIHHMLFAAAAPEVLVMTSANRASEPIAFEDEDARTRLAGIADAFLVGERPIARRMDDSIVHAGHVPPIVVRRSRGYAPDVVARLSASRSILAVGADLKNTVALAVNGDVLTSQHVGDLEYFDAYDAFRSTIDDLTAMYEVKWDEIVVAHDAHPHYASTLHALELPARAHVAVQHHRAHVASVLAEHTSLDLPVIGIAFDGTGYGDDGTIWGGEFFAGSATGGLSRVASLKPFELPGGDAAARHPVQAAAGLLLDMDGLPQLTAWPFSFSERYDRARRLARGGLRTFRSTSAGRLFDCTAALLGFVDEIEYEGQAATWLEQLARCAGACDPLPFEIAGGHLDFRPALRVIIERRRAGHDSMALARAFHETIAVGIARMAVQLCDEHRVDTIAVSGGTFQNALLVDRLRASLPRALRLWTNMQVPPNDGGISVGQAAIASVSFV